MAKNPIDINHSKNRTMGIILVACAAISLSFLPILFNLLSQNKIGIGTQVLTRLIIGAFTLLIWNNIFGLRNRTRQSLSRSIITLSFLNGIVLLAAFISYNLAIGLGTSPAKAILLIYLSPLYIGLFSWFFLKERFGVRKILAIITGVIGILIAIGFWNIRDLYIYQSSDWLAVLNGFLSAFIVIIGKKSGSFKELSFLEFLQYSLFFALLWGLLLTAITQTVEYNRFALWDLTLNTQTVLLLIAIGIFGTTIPYILLYKGLQYLEASVSGLVLLLEPISVFILQALVLGVPIFWWQIIGGSIVFASGYFVQSESK